MRIPGGNKKGIAGKPSIPLHVRWNQSLFFFLFAGRSLFCSGLSRRLFCRFFFCALLGFRCFGGLCYRLLSGSGCSFFVPSAAASCFRFLDCNFLVVNLV